MQIVLPALLGVVTLVVAVIGALPMPAVGAPGFVQAMSFWAVVGLLVCYPIRLLYLFRFGRLFWAAGSAAKAEENQNDEPDPRE